MQKQIFYNNTKIIELQRFFGIIKGGKERRDTAKKKGSPSTEGLPDKVSKRLRVKLRFPFYCGFAAAVAFAAVVHVKVFLQAL